MKAGSSWYPTGLILVVGVALALAGCAPVPAGREAGPPRADTSDLVAIHTAGSPHFNKACLSCHGDIMKRPTLNPKFKEAHAAMIPFAPDYDAKVGVTNQTCVSCHAKVDVIQHSGTQIRKNSDVTACAGCHGKAGVSSKKFYVD
jgi:hypothetical protein